MRPSAPALYSKRGWAQHGVYRAVGYTYTFHAEYFGVIDEKGYPPTGQNQGGEELKAERFPAAAGCSSKAPSRWTT